MGFYEFVIVIGTIIFTSFLWTFLSYTTDTISDKFAAATPEDLPNNMTSKVKQQYSLASNTYYFVLLFISIIGFLWVVKRTQRENGVRWYGS